MALINYELIDSRFSMACDLFGVILKNMKLYAVILPFHLIFNTLGHYSHYFDGYDYRDHSIVQGDKIIFL